MTDPTPAPADIAERFGYHTHQGALLWALEQAPGAPVLELGMGESSTPLLREHCGKAGKTLVSVETDPTWADRFRKDAPDWHQIHLAPVTTEAYEGDPLAGVPDWNLFPFGMARWGVALVDCRPSAGRLLAIAALKPLARFIVVHDTEQPLYYFEPLLATFRHRHDWRGDVPWTTVVSDVASCDVGILESIRCANEAAAMGQEEVANA